MADPKTSPVLTVPPPQAPYQPQGPPIQPQGPPTNQPNSQPAPIGFNVPGGPPPSYGEATGHSSWKLSHVDFSPVCIGSGSLLKWPTYERFDVVVQRANQWLQQHPEVQVKTCESIENKVSHFEGVSTDRTTFHESGEMSTSYIRSLRLFIIPAEPGSRPQQIGYLNVMPACSDPGGMFSAPVFEGFGETIIKFNQMLRQRPLPGSILNIETQEMKFKTWNNEVDPDSCFWNEHGDRRTYFLNVIRIFYAAGQPACEEIGFMDFIPDCLSHASGMLSYPTFAPFQTVVQKASIWIQQQQGIKVTNVQSFDCKLKSGWSGNVLNPQQALFYNDGDWRTWYVRILRVYYVRLFNGVLPPRPPPILTYKTFLPVQLTSGGLFMMAEFEPMSTTMKRAMAWFQYNTGVNILAAETVPVRLYSGNQNGNTEQTFTYNPGSRGERWLFVLRVYMDGIYQEPLASALPALPAVQQVQQGTNPNDCCTIL